MRINDIWFAADDTYAGDAVLYTEDGDRVRLFGSTNATYCYCTVPTPIEEITLDLVPSI